MKLQQLRKIIREEIQREFLGFGKKKKTNPLETDLSIDGQLYRLKDYLSSIGFTDDERLYYNQYLPAMEYAENLDNIDNLKLSKIFSILWKGYENASPDSEEVENVLRYIQTGDDSGV